MMKFSIACVLVLLPLIRGYGMGLSNPAINEENPDLEILPEFELAELRTAFREDLNHVIEEAISMIKPKIEELDVNLEDCEAEVMSVKQECTTCMDNTCPNNQDIVQILENWTEGDQDIDDLPDMPEARRLPEARRFGHNRRPGKRWGWGSKVVNTISNTATNVVNTVSNAAKPVVHTVASSVGNFFKGWGRRKRSTDDMSKIYTEETRARLLEYIKSLNPETRDCLAECKQCVPFIAKKTYIMAEICGNDMVMKLMALERGLKRLDVLAKYNEETSTPLLVKVAIYRSSEDPDVMMPMITATFPHGEKTYKSDVTFDAEDPETVTNLALEYFDYVSRDDERKTPSRMPMKPMKSMKSMKKRFWGSWAALAYFG